MNWSQIQAVGRHVASYAAGALTIAVAFRVLSPAQAADLQTNLDVLFDALTKLATAIGGIIGVLTPIYTAWRAQKSASPVEKAKSLEQEVPGTVIVTAPDIAKSVPSPNVVSKDDMKVVPK